MGGSPKYKGVTTSGGLTVSGEILTVNFSLESGNEDAQALIDQVKTSLHDAKALGEVSEPVYVMQVVDDAPVFTASFSITVMPQQPE